MPNKDRKKFLKNPWTISIGGTAIGTILASLAFKINLFVEAIKLFWKLVVLFWNLINSRVSLPVWAVIILILLIPSIFLLILAIAPKKKEDKPIFLEYTQDTFNGIVFRWQWEYLKYSNKYDIENLAAFCPVCDCQLINRSWNFECPSCGFRKSDFNKSEVELGLLIRHEARKKYISNR